MKHLRYFKYVCKHKWFVFLSGLKTDAPLWRLIIHDYTKFTPAEWSGYVNRFFSGRSGVTDKSNDSEEFHRAWTHHWHRNPHHWEYWLAMTDDNGVRPMDMPDHFINEMVADWMGAGRAITGKWEVNEWYSKNKDRMVLTPRTRDRVEQLMKFVNGYDGS